jgi:hypothetical protein
MENAQLVPIEQSGGELSLSRPAEVVLREAEMVAKPWGQKVESLQLFKSIGDKKHLYIEAWQMMAAMYRVTARVRETRFLDYGEVKGFEAVAEAFHIPTGQVISTAEAMCLNDEDKWGPRTKYEYVDGRRQATGFVPTPLQQLRSMAQTRACSKVLSNLFKWVAVMKGYQGTPAEEMTGDEHGDRPHAPAPPQRRSQAAPASGNAISEAQGKRMFAIARGAGLDTEGYRKFLETHGFSRTDEVSRDRYEQMCAELEALKGDLAR